MIDLKNYLILYSSPFISDKESMIDLKNYFILFFSPFISDNESVIGLKIGIFFLKSI